MTTPPTPASGAGVGDGDGNGDGDAAGHTGPVDLGKHTAAEPEVPFDPYRFGRPDHPVPPEFAPPGYVPDPPAGPAGPPPNPYGAPPDPYGAPPNPYGAPPNPYGAPPNPYGQRHVAQPYHPYGAPGTQYPPYPGYGYQAAPTGGNGKAIAAMVLGIASIPLFFLTFFDLALIIPALIFGILGLGEAKRRNGVGRRQAVAGLVCMIVGAIAATVFTTWLFTRISGCEHFARDGDQSAYQQCVSNRFG